MGEEATHVKKQVEKDRYLKKVEQQKEERADQRKQDGRPFLPLHYIVFIFKFNF